MKHIAFIFLLLLFISSCTMKQQRQENTHKVYPTIGNIERLEERLNQIIPLDAKIEILAEGFAWSEGPVWVPALNSLLFSDIPNNRIWRWSEKDSLQPYLHPSGYFGTQMMAEPGSNGLMLDAQGSLILCQHGERQVAKMDAPIASPKATFKVFADKYEGKRLNSPNDLKIDRLGNIYFTDPPYGLPKQMEDTGKELPFQGVYRINTNGSIDLLTDKMTRPNGLELSPDERTLYVANSDPDMANWMAFDLSSNGKLENHRIFMDATTLVGTAGNEGLPDGMVISKSGIIFATGPGGVWVMDAAGKVLGKIRTTQKTANCTFDASEDYLYMTADSYLLRLKVKV